jgi:hypothetical protein
MGITTEQSKKLIKLIDELALDSGWYDSLWEIGVLKSLGIALNKEADREMISVAEAIKEHVPDYRRNRA